MSVGRQITDWSIVQRWRMMIHAKREKGKVKESSKENRTDLSRLGGAEANQVEKEIHRKARPRPKEYLRLKTCLSWRMRAGTVAETTPSICARPDWRIKGGPKWTGMAGPLPRIGRTEQPCHVGTSTKTGNARKAKTVPGRKVTCDARIVHNCISCELTK